MYDARDNNPFPAVDLILRGGHLVTHLRCIDWISCGGWCMGGITFRHDEERGWNARLKVEDEKGKDSTARHSWAIKWGAIGGMCLCSPSCVSSGISQSGEISREKNRHAVKLTAVGDDLNSVRPWVSF